jgi:hypothetical protein
VFVIDFVIDSLHKLFDTPSGLYLSVIQISGTNIFKTGCINKEQFFLHFSQVALQVTNRPANMAACFRMLHERKLYPLHLEFSLHRPLNCGQINPSGNRTEDDGAKSSSDLIPTE